MKKEIPKKIQYNDKFPTEHITKIYMNQFEMAEKINEIIAYLYELEKRLRSEVHPNL